MSLCTLRTPLVSALGRRFRVVLASGSPRRKELLDRLGIEYEVIPSGFAEDLDKSQFATAGDYVVENAAQKAGEVYRRVRGGSARPLFVIGADTVVVDAGGAILEKPASGSDAAATLKGLGGKTNTVHTGVCLVVDDTTRSSGGEPRVLKALESTEVVFGEVDDAMAEVYAATGEPMDKAGSYAYQSLACFFVSAIRGDYYNVVGFPCARFYQMLRELDAQGAI
ncbi:hypothetical protein H4R18_004208 [Coemansia javaensis]|uniref:Maf-like protein n=1 Tax=Coemansia javaensis TaxID=2761396 RepID=A0A9W8H8D5_9FUNG|nr:hypothetical protein H4R18_004208 [Coemansia javaensis]